MPQSPEEAGDEDLCRIRPLYVLGTTFQSILLGFAGDGGAAHAALRAVARRRGRRAPPGRRPLTGTAALAARGADVAEATEAPAQRTGGEMARPVEFWRAHAWRLTILTISDAPISSAVLLPAVAMAALVVELGARVLALT